MAVDQIDHDIGHLLAVIIPGGAVRQDGSHVLAE